MSFAETIFAYSSLDKMKVATTLLTQDHLWEPPHKLPRFNMSLLALAGLDYVLGTVTGM